MAQAGKVAVDFQRIVDETGVTLDTAFNEFLAQFYRQLLINTPVDTGFLRASWFPSVNGPQALEPPASDVSAGAVPPTVVQRMEAIDATAEDTVYISNGANYGVYVEARQNFVDRTIASAPRLLDQAITEIRTIRGDR